ncbi:hypothetical protein EVAR_57529_1 [Eumeta japonica]|uniref:Uncharacterized protein n=1 Tax=Eumeta variegata TaxID=151549 RepID=A0A4C1Y4G4_EUMVA|nr:hypothetical protein EVAR_57529_1 [Eumeta japonica]
MGRLRPSFASQSQFLRLYTGVATPVITEERACYYHCNSERHFNIRYLRSAQISSDRGKRCGTYKKLKFYERCPASPLKTGVTDPARPSVIGVKRLVTPRLTVTAHCDVFADEVNTTRRTVAGRMSRSLTVRNAHTTNDQRCSVFRCGARHGGPKIPPSMPTITTDPQLTHCGRILTCSAGRRTSPVMRAAMPRARHAQRSSC